MTADRDTLAAVLPCFCATPDDQHLPKCPATWRNRVLPLLVAARAEAWDEGWIGRAETLAQWIEAPTDNPYRADALDADGRT